MFPIGNIPIPGVVGCYGEAIRNENGKLLLTLLPLKPKNYK